MVFSFQLWSGAPGGLVIMALKFEPEMSPGEAKRTRMRSRILEELAKTEETYQQHLSLVVKVQTVILYVIAWHQTGDITDEPSLQ